MMWMVSIAQWSGLGYAEATRKALDRNHWRQLIISDTAVVGLRYVVILTKVKNAKTFFLRMWNESDRY